MSIICTRCYSNIIIMNKKEQICDRCKDILEFGYPSFPAYRLTEKEKEKENRTEGSAQSQGVVNRTARLTS